MADTYWFISGYYKPSLLADPYAQMSLEELEKETSEHGRYLMAADPQTTSIVLFHMICYSLGETKRPELARLGLRVSSILVNLLYICGACGYSCS